MESKKQILLIEPLLRTKYKGLYDDFGKQYDLPYGLLAIGSYLDTKGIESKIISMDYETDSLKKSDEEVLKQYLFESKPDIVGFTSYTLQYEDVKRLTGIVRKQDPDIKVVIGGHHAMHQPEKVLETGLFDVVIVGEGEKTLEEYITKISRGDSIRDIKGIVYLDDKELIKTSKRERIQGEEIVTPDYSLLPKELVKDASLEIITSRGCPYDCFFCSSTAQYGRKVESRSLDSVKKEIETLVKEYDQKEIGILDETLHARKDFDEFIQMLKELHEDYGVTYLAQTRADMVLKDPESLASMKEAGIVSLLIGAESASDKVLSAMGKRHSYEIIPKALEEIKKAEIKTGTFWIVGHPGSSYEEEMKTKQAIDDLLQRDLSDYTEVNIFVPYARTKASRDKRIKKIDSDFVKFDRMTEAVFDLQGFPREKIKQAYLEIVSVLEKHGK